MKNKIRSLFVALLSIAYLLSPIPSKAGSDSDTSENEDILQAVQRALTAQSRDMSASEYVMVPIAAHYQGDWAYTDFGVLDSSNEVQPSMLPPALLRWTGQQWSVALPGEGSYGEWLDSIPASLIDDSTKSYLQVASGLNVITASANVTGYRFPWLAGHTAKALCIESNAKGDNCLYKGAIYHGYPAADLFLDDFQVRAAKSGIVIFRKDTSDKLPCDSNACYRQANLVVIKSADNEYAWYMHLAYGSVPSSIQEGAWIQQGTFIGTQGCNGWCMGEHLHFHVATSWSSPNDNNDPVLRMPPYPSSFARVDFTEMSWSSLNATSWKQVLGSSDKTPAVILYENPGYQGRSLALYDSDLDLCHDPLDPTQPPLTSCFSAQSWNDIASSITVMPGYRAVLHIHNQADADRWHDDATMSYSCNTNIPDFRGLVFPNGTPLNDNVSRVIIEKCGASHASASAASLSAPLSDPCVPDPGPVSDSAAFVSNVALSDGSNVSPGQALVRTWRLSNVGTTTWGSGYQLAFLRGDQMSAPPSVNVPLTAPNATTDMSVGFAAPSSPGAHTSYWRLRNPQGAYFGPELSISINVVASNGGIGTGHITSFDASPASPSAATSVHLVGRIKAFPEYRSMRFVVGNQSFEGPGFRAVGDGTQYEISTDWNTASLARGNYSIAFEVATKDDLNWTRPERQMMVYNLTGSPAVVVAPPERPILKSPYNWYLYDASGGAASAQLCVYPTTDPGGYSVQYWFDVNNGATSSGWISSNCWTNSFNPFGYAWRVKARNSQGAESAWSADTWNFTVATGGVSVGGISFYNVNTNDTHICVPVTYGGIQGPNVRAWMNLATDGSENGEWKLLDGYGPNAAPDCTQSNVYGWWIRSPEYQTGNHRIRVNAYKPDSGASATNTSNYNIPYLRPNTPEPMSPSTLQNNGTWWNTRQVAFQWKVALRTQSQQLRVSTNSYPWDDPAPLVNVTLGGTDTSYVQTFSQDYGRLYWSVRATNSAGNADFGGGIWFGVDQVKPSCVVQTLPAVSYENVFQVNWVASDNSAGVHAYNVQYMDTGRSGWIDWLTQIPAGKPYEQFTGQPGHTYAFRCASMDNAGNTGDYPGTANTSTRVDPTARPSTPWWNTSWMGKRNLIVQNNMPAVTMPVGYPVRIRFDGGTTPTAADLYNASQSNPKCNDLRVIYNDTTQLNRLVTSCTSNLIEFWFRTQTAIPGSSTNSTSHQLYYGNPSAGAPPADASQLWYPYKEGDTTNLYYFQEGSGTFTADYSGNNRHCTINPTVQWATGRWGYGLRFSRANGGNTVSLTCGSPFPLSAFTVEFWYKPSTTGDIGSRVTGQLGPSNQLSWLLSIEGDRLKFERWCNGGSQQAQGNVNFRQTPYFTQWNYVAATFDGGSQVKFYVNGALDRAITLNNSCSATYNIPLEIGSVESSGQGEYSIGAYRLSNSVKTDFYPSTFVAITAEPTLGVGSPIAPPVTGNADLSLDSISTYLDPSGTLVQAVVRNKGNLSTQNGFYTDLYVNHVPVGTGDYTGSLRFWVNDPVAAGSTVTLTTLITNSSSLLSLANTNSIPPPGAEVTGMLYAQTDSAGAVSELDNANNIYSTGTQVCFASSDAYESDDTAQTAALITVGITQTHNISKLGDQDWVKFTAQSGKTYSFDTLNLGSGADTYLYLYGTDRVTLLASNDDYGGSLASHIEWKALTSGTYYVLVQHWNPNAGGCGTIYNLLLSLPLAHHLYLPSVLLKGPTISSSVNGRVLLTNTSPVNGVLMSLNNGQSTTTNLSGAYSFSGLSSGSYTLTPTKSGYTFLPQSHVVTVPPDASSQDFIATPVSWTLSYTAATPVIRKLIVYNGKLYAAGDEGQTNGRLYVFDGTTWADTNLAININTTVDQVTSLQVFNGRLYIGMRVNVGGIKYGRVYYYDGSTFTLDLSREVQDWWGGIEGLTVYNGSLYGANGSPISEVYQRISDDHSVKIGQPVEANVVLRTLAAYDGSLYAGTGGFGNQAKLWRWTGTTWALVKNFEVDLGIDKDGVSSLVVAGSRLYVGLSGPAIPTPIMEYNGTDWTVSTSQGCNEVSLTAVGDVVWAGACDGQMYQYDGSIWEYAGDTGESRVLSFAEYNGFLYASTMSNGRIFRLKVS